MATTGRFMGVDISPFVQSWGRLEQIKDVLLATATLLTTQMSIEIIDFRGFARAFGTSSLLGGLNWYNQLLEIFIDDRLIYQGLTKNIPSNATTGTAIIETENLLKKPAESVVVASDSGVGPAAAMLGLLRRVLTDDSLDVGSFQQADGAALANGASIDYAFDEGTNATLLQAVQSISELGSLSVFVFNNRITCRAFVPYQGNGVGLRATIDDSIAREWGNFEYDNSSFNNRVTVGFPTGVDTSDTATLDNVASQRENGDLVRGIQFPADDVVKASNLTSGQYFGKIYLQRASNRRAKLTVAAGPDLVDTIIGDRFPITSVKLGVTDFPMEAIEVHRSLDNDEVELAFAQVFQT